MSRSDILERKQDIIKWIKENQSKSYICQQLSCRPSTLDNYLKKLDIQYNGNQGGKGIKSDPKRKTALEYSKSTCVKSNVLKFKLFEDGIREQKCEECGITEWMGQEAPLELHHIDGDRFNNNFINLQILCSNCHSLTPNYSGKKVKINL